MEELAYGPAPEQTGDLHLPAGPGPHPVVALWHGGGFAAEYGRAMLTPAAEDLAARGWAAWNVTYRREGSGGGWPATFEDARAALAHLAQIDAPLQLADVTALGFSAGLPPALYAARAGGPVAVRRLVNVAGVSALEATMRGGGRGSAMWRVLGDPDVAPAAYAAADPSRGLPSSFASLTVHGDADVHVPVAMSEAWVDASRAAGDDARLVVVPGGGHFDVHVPGTPGWEAVVTWLAG
jgi:acetyl esterase/lipase